VSTAVLSPVEFPVAVGECIGFPGVVIQRRAVLKIGLADEKIAVAADVFREVLRQVSVGCGRCTSGQYL
jgi:hypothetical protein